MEGATVISLVSVTANKIRNDIKNPGAASVPDGVANMVINSLTGT